ncbi:MAG: hypothetical protein HUU50_08860 [Candidatus Brocadiae bacterium]|nr:hypothetical protein [Candidatus Brocadiia bacterium]
MINPFISHYLNFAIGNVEDARGRAFLYVQDANSTYPIIKRTIDIDGASLKEALYHEIKDGRLILPDVFEPFFVKVSCLDKGLSFQEVADYGKKEQRDIIFLALENQEQERLLEQGIARYTTIVRENIYLRLIRQLTNEIFHKKRRIPTQPIYVALLKLAEWICLITRSRREDNHVEVAYFSNLIQNLQKDLPQLNLQKIIPALTQGDACLWHEIADYIDVFFLTLKENYPLALETDALFTVKQDCTSWLLEEIPALYHEYFLALLQEKYEKALQLKHAIDTHHSSQPLEGRR